MIDVLALIIAIVALVLASVAFARSGGVEDLRRQMQNIGSTTSSARDRTADVLDRLEQLIRGKDKREPGEPGGPGGSPPAA
jgi:hypothetical protein